MSCPDAPADTPPLLAGVEAGGTKFVCALARGQDVLAQARIETADPATTIAAVTRFLAQAKASHGRAHALGIASFGPIDLDPASPDHGRLTTTPKPGWSGFDICGALGNALDLPVAIDTDVNAAALAEVADGAARGCTNAAYVTIGTGVGVGLVINGGAVHGIGHPEAGHIHPRRHPDHQGFAGVCPYHGDCLEGLASGPAIAAAWGKPLYDLPWGHAAHRIEADYLGQLCATLILTAAPQRIVIGGGVMNDARLYPLIRHATARWLNGYADNAIGRAGGLDRLIVPPGCAIASGLAGALLLARQAMAISQACCPSSTVRNR